MCVSPSLVVTVPTFPFRSHPSCLIHPSCCSLQGRTDLRRLRYFPVVRGRSPVLLGPTFLVRTFYYRDSKDRARRTSMWKGSYPVGCVRVCTCERVCVRVRGVQVCVFRSPYTCVRVCAVTYDVRTCTYSACVVCIRPYVCTSVCTGTRVCM